VFEIGVLRRAFGSRGEEVTVVWRGPHNEGLHYLYASSDIIRMLKSKWMKLTKHVAYM
jgi:hypothetical protein